MTRPAAPCAALVGGVAALGPAPAAVYGTGKTVQYRNADGGYVTTASFGELLREAVFSDEDMARAAALLLAGNLPEQGVKTALILLSALLERGTQAGCAEETWRQVFTLLDYGATFTERVAAENVQARAEVRTGAPVGTGGRRGYLRVGAASSASGRGDGL